MHYGSGSEYGVGTGFFAADIDKARFLLKNHVKYCLDPETEQKPKLFQSWNRNHNKSLWSSTTQWYRKNILAISDFLHCLI